MWCRLKTYDRFVSREKDAHGYDLLNYRGDDGKVYKAYANKPGLDGEDVDRTMWMAARYAGGSKLAGAFTKGKNLVTKAGAQMLAAAGVSVGSDKAAQQMGSQQPVDWVKAGIAAGTAGLIEVAPSALQGVKNAYTNKMYPNQIGNTAKEELKKEVAGEIANKNKLTTDSFLDSKTATGDKVHHGSHSTAIGDDAATVNNFNNVSHSNNGHNAIVHGKFSYDNAGGIPVVNGKETNIAQIAEAIRENPNYTKGSKICFGSCWSGSSGTAQELADELAAPVLAPTRPVAWDPKTDKWVFDSDYEPLKDLSRSYIKPEWKMFYPNKK